MITLHFQLRRCKCRFGKHGGEWEKIPTSLWADTLKARLVWLQKNFNCSIRLSLSELRDNPLDAVFLLFYWPRADRVTCAAYVWLSAHAHHHLKTTERHSRPQRPRTFWSAPRIATSGQVQRHSVFEWLWKHNRLSPEPIRFVRLDSLCEWFRVFQTAVWHIYYNQRIAWGKWNTVGPPLTATSLQRVPFCHRERSIHSLLFKPLCNGNLSASQLPK